MADGVTAVQGELTLLPPDPWNGLAREAPAGAMRPELAAADTEGVRGGPGRPPGRPNNRADDLTSYIARRYGSPLEHAAKLCAKPLAELAREMGVRGIVAAQHKLAVRKLLARYIEAAPPKPVLMAARMTNVLAEAHFRAASELGVKLADPPAPEPQSRPSNVISLPGMPPRGPD